MTGQKQIPFGNDRQNGNGKGKGNGNGSRRKECNCERLWRMAGLRIVAKVEVKLGSEPSEFYKAGKPKEPDEPIAAPSRRTLLGLVWLNFQLADVQTGVAVAAFAILYLFMPETRNTQLENL